MQRWRGWRPRCANYPRNITMVLPWRCRLNPPRVNAASRQDSRSNWRTKMTNGVGQVCLQYVLLPVSDQCAGFPLLCRICVPAAARPHKRSIAATADVHYTGPSQVNYAYDKSATMQADSCRMLYSQSGQPEHLLVESLTERTALCLINVWFNSRLWPACQFVVGG